MDSSWLVAVGALAAALALGLVPAMTAFVGRVAFRTLSEPSARAFLRAAFPIYHIQIVVFAGIGAAALALPRPVDAGILACVAITALFSWLWLTPIAHRLDDLRRDGQEVQRELMQIQGRSSLIVVAQTAALAAVVIRLAVL